MRLSIAAVALLGLLVGTARADDVAVVLVPGPGASAAQALAPLPARTRAAARHTRDRLVQAVPPGPALARLEEQRLRAREKMAAFTELEEAEQAVAEALAAAFDALPYLDDVSIPVALAFDLATVRLTLGDRDGAGEALGLSARLDPAVAADPGQHPPQLQALAAEIRPPSDAAPSPLPPALARALGERLGCRTLVLARPAPGGSAEVFVVDVADGREEQRGRIEPDGSTPRALHARLVALGLASEAPRQAVGPVRSRAHPPRPRAGSSPWPWLAPTLIGVAAAAGAVLYFALPAPRDDARIVPEW